MKLLLVLTLIFSSNTFARDDDGGWVGSGGQLFRDAHNPWFVRNTTSVSYCVQIDQSSISADRETIEISIDEALNYWRQEFRRVNRRIEGGQFKLGGQNFVKGTCSDKTDVRFLFGYGTLNEKEIKAMKKPERYIGISMRTNYDEENLKGKGFVYISSDLGPHQYDNKGNLIQNAWKHKKLLRYVLIHELGHIFGIPHTGNGIMSEVFFDQLLNKFLVEKFLKFPIESFLHPSDVLEVCGALGTRAKPFFGMEASDQCIVMRVKNQMMSSTWEVYAKTTPESEERHLGTIKNVRPNLFDYRGKPASILQLTKKQKVFTDDEVEFRSFMLGPMIADSGSQGVFMSKKGGIPQIVYVKITSTSVSILGANKNRVDPVFIYNSPLSVLMLISPKP